MANETPIHVFIDKKLLEQLDTERVRLGWSRKEAFNRLIQDALPRLKAANPPLTAAK